MVLLYPVVFAPTGDDGKFSVTFPDFPGTVLQFGSGGYDGGYETGYYLAREFISAFLLVYGYVEPSSILDVQAPPGGFVSLIQLNP